MYLILKGLQQSLAEDGESTKCHLGAIIIRDLSLTVSNYRSRITLEEYCKQQGVLGIAGIDTRALTKALRDTGCLVGVLTTDASKSDADLVKMAKSWTIVGKDLLSVVSCDQPYEWRRGTDSEWEFAQQSISNSAAPHPYHVSIYGGESAYVILPVISCSLICIQFLIQLHNFRWWPMTLALSITSSVVWPPMDARSPLFQRHIPPLMFLK